MEATIRKYLVRFLYILWQTKVEKLILLIIRAHSCVFYHNSSINLGFSINEKPLHGRGVVRTGAKGAVALAPVDFGKVGRSELNNHRSIHGFKFEIPNGTPAMM